MLGKLLKYDLKLFWRKLMPMYGGILALAVLMGATIRFTDFFENSSIGMSVMSLISIAFFVFICIAIVMTIIILVQSYYRNLLGNQGYLMFSLPVSTRTIVTSKLISATILIIIGGIVGVLSFVIVYALQIGDTINNFSIQYFMRAMKEIDINVQVTSGIGLVLLTFINTIVETASNIAQVYASISVAHAIKSNSVGTAWAVYIASGIIVSLINSMFDNFTILMTQNQQLVCSTIGNIIYMFIFWAISWIVLDRKLNLV